MGIPLDLPVMPPTLVRHARRRAAAGRAALLLPPLLALPLPAQQPPSAPLPDSLPPAGIVERPLVLGRAPWQLQARLSLPARGTNVPGVILMHGSGPGTRDGDVGPNKVFREVAWALASRGIAVLRYDKRTTAHAERFRARGAEATMEEEHVADAIDALRQLQTAPEVDPSRTFVLAGSQGTTVAATVALRLAREGGHPVAGLVLASVGSRPPAEMILEQVDHVVAVARQAGDSAAVREALALRPSVERLQRPDAPDSLTLFGKPLAYWRSLDPQATWRETREYLATGGRLLVASVDRDYLTTPADHEAWRRALAGSPRTAFRRYPDLNHLMQPGVGKMTPDEYARPMQVSRTYLADVAAWIVAGRLPSR